jgi:alkylation response protein AidB-like acyl-CoA dehydrogenase
VDHHRGHRWVTVGVVTDTDTARLVAAAHDIADGVLFPASVEVDRTGTVPTGHWQRLAESGLYGIAAPAQLGGPGLGLPQLVEILETLAGACLATTFTWVQHHGMVAALAASPNTALRDEVLPEVVAGRIRGGVAYAGAVPVPPRVRAERVDGGWRLSGHAPFVSGWGIIDLLQISAGDITTGDIVAGVIPAKSQAGITNVSAVPLFVADATRTVSLDIDGLLIRDDRIVSRVSRPDFMANQNFGSRLNGTLPLGIAGRCTRLIDALGHGDAAMALQAKADAVRARLDAGMTDSAELLAARAEGAELAVRAAGALVAATGGPALTISSPAQLLARNATFTVVAASRPELKELLVGRFSF